MSNKSTVVRGIAATFITQIISWILSFVVMLYLPRYLGAAGLGKFSFASSFVAIFTVIMPLGTSEVLIREIARDRSRTGELLLSAILIRLPLAVLMTVVAIVAVRLLGYPALTRTLVGLMALGMIALGINDALAAALQGQEKLPRQNVAVLVEKFLSSGLTILLVICHAPLWTLATVSLATYLVSALVHLTAFRQILPTLRRPSAATVRALAIAGLPFVGWTLFRTLYGQTDPIILSVLTDDKTVGWYAAAFRLICTTLILPTALTTALYPTLSRLYKDDIPAFQALARRMLSLILLCGMPVAMVFICQPGRLVSLLRYTADFSGSVPVLRIGGVGVFLYYAAAVLGTLVIASDGQAKMLRASAAATALGIPACFLCSYLTHRFWHNGAIGAMGSDVLLEAYLILSYLRMVPQNTFDSESVSLIGRSILAALPIAALLALTARNPLGLWMFLPGIPLYLVMCWLLRCLDPQYLLMARSILKRSAKA